MKKDKIVIWASQGQGSALVWKGTSYKVALLKVFNLIGSGSIGIKINDKWIKKQC